MSLSKIPQINKAIQEYFEQHPSENKLLAKELMPYFIQKGIFGSDQREGLPIRKILRDIDAKGQLALIPFVLPERKSTNTNWYFIRSNKGNSHTESAQKTVAIKPQLQSVIHSKQSFAPVIDQECTVLILGSLPGDESLRKGEYYANPNNHFWKLVGSLFGHLPDSYAARVNLLLQHHIALWDVLQSASRAGSLDSAIRNGIANDLPALIIRYPSIRTVFFNGLTAEHEFKKAFPETFHGVRFHRLPSTSSAKAMKWEEKLNSWKIIIQHNHT